MKQALVLLARPAARRPSRPAAAIDPSTRVCCATASSPSTARITRPRRATLRLACFGMLDEPQLAGGLPGAPRPGAGRRRRPRGFPRRPSSAWSRSRSGSRATARGSWPPELRAALEPRLAARLPAATLAGGAGLPLDPGEEAGPPAARRAGADRRRGRPSACPVAGSPRRRASAASSRSGPPGPNHAGQAQPPRRRRQRRSAAPTAAHRRRAQEARPGPPAPRRAGPAKELRQAFQLARAGGRRPPGLEGGAAPGRRGRPTASPAGATPRSTSAAAAIPARTSPSGSSTWPSRSTSRGTPRPPPPPSSALPNLKRTPYVEAYVRKILGQ